MCSSDLIQPSQSSFSAPVVLVHKKDGSWQMCPDYRELNKLTIKDKFSIPMGGADVVLGVQWLQSLGMVAFNFQELFLNFFSERKEVELRGIVGKPGKIISSNVMKKLLKKEQRGIISQLCSLEVPTLKSSISTDLQKVLDNHSKVFETPKGLPPIRDHDLAIHGTGLDIWTKEDPHVGMCLAYLEVHSIR